MPSNLSPLGLDKPDIGIRDDAFLAEVRNLPERHLAVELLERLLKGEIKSRFASNVVQNKKSRTCSATWSSATATAPSKRRW